MFDRFVKMLIMVTQLHEFTLYSFFSYINLFATYPYHSRRKLQLVPIFGVYELHFYDFNFGCRRFKLVIIEGERGSKVPALPTPSPKR